MCGLVALWGLGDADSLERMTDLQAHRGPDDRGTWSNRLSDGTFIGLGSRRLAIRDLSPLGHMPMALEEAGLQLVYNGEIYNADALRRELESAGVRFRGHSDTEVILHAIARWGTAAIGRLEGMFALALFDSEGRVPGLGGSGPALLIARDGFGIKPLYLHESQGGLAVTSEAKSLLRLPGFKAEPDPLALHRYMTLLWAPEPDSMFAGVSKLEPGHWAVFRGGRLRKEQFWDVPVVPGGVKATDREAATEAVSLAFGEAVRSQMVSDVPLGAFLSAGVDSSAIVGRMAESAEQPVKTFTITFPEEHRVGETTLDDPAVAARTAAHFGCDHQEIVVEPDVAELLPNLVWHLDDPVADPAALTAYSVCTQAKDSVTVLLSGIGGDELFGGYRKHAALRLNRLYRSLPRGVRSGVVEPLVNAMPGLRGSSLMGLVRHARKFVRTADRPALEAFLATSEYMDTGTREGLYSGGLAEATRGSDPLSRHRAHLEHVAQGGELDRALYVDIKTFLPSLNLLYNDRMSMACSVEIRVPFLDRPLTEVAFEQVRGDWKVDGHLRPVTKSILRDAVRHQVPAEVLRQKKAGFGGPHDHWLMHQLRPMVDELLSVEQIRRRGFFRPEAVRRIVESHRSGRADQAYSVWQFLTLELWMRAFVDGDGLGQSGV